MGKPKYLWQEKITELLQDMKNRINALVKDPALNRKSWKLEKRDTERLLRTCLNIRRQKQRYDTERIRADI